MAELIIKTCQEFRNSWSAGKMFHLGAGYLWRRIIPGE